MTDPYVAEEITQQGNITICTLIDSTAEKTFAGAACCNVRDKFDPMIGAVIARGRAMKQRADYYAKYAFGR